MLFKAVSDMIGEVGVPYAYYAFPENTEQTPPYIIFWFPQNDGFFADGVNYVNISVLYIELYTNEKDPAMEKAVEDVLRKYGISYEKSEDSIESELMTLVRYSTEVILEDDPITEDQNG